MDRLRHSPRGPNSGEADRLLMSVLIAGAVPHLFKLLVRRARPDRLVRVPGRGIPRSGNPWDSFPSGHAVHLGAAASSFARLAPKSLRPIIWSALVSVSATRVMLLAHYVTDVLVGWALGILISNATASLDDGPCARRAFPPGDGDEGTAAWHEQRNSAKQGAC